MSDRSAFSFHQLLLVMATLISGCATQSHDLRPRTAFIGLANFSAFTQTPGASADEIVLTSPEINPPIQWNELVASWNTVPGAWLKVEARGIYPDHSARLFADHATRYYTLGLWSEDPALHPRESITGQRDADGRVKTDTLLMARAGARVQLRITLGTSSHEAPSERSLQAATNRLQSLTLLPPEGGVPVQGVDPQTPGLGIFLPPTRALLKFIGLSFCDDRAQLAPAAPNRAAWGKVLPVPELRQAEYGGGDGWCSPVSLSMVLAYWATAIHRPELDRPVPEVATCSVMTYRALS